MFCIPPRRAPYVGGVFPHYAPGTTPLTNLEGVELAGIGTNWVEYGSFNLSMQSFGFPYLDPQIPIPCP